MAKALLVKIEPTILKYARKYSGFSMEQVSKKSKIPVSKLEEYENQVSEASLTHLEKLSIVYKRPLAFFLLSKVPTDAVEPKDFRIVYSSEEGSQFSPDEYLAIRRARYVQSVIAEFSETNLTNDLPSSNLNSDIENISKKFREYIGVNLKQQQKWGNSPTALREWKNTLEEKNIFVLQHSLPKDDISAFCLADKKPYVIVLNSSDHENRRIFSLFHEIGHLILHKSGICTTDDLSRNSYEYQQIEKFCNQFAASFLLPKEEFLNDSSVKFLIQKPANQWSEADIGNVAFKFKVSNEVILRRFLTLRYIDEPIYHSWRKIWQKKYIDLKNKKVNNKPIKIPQYIKCLSQNGRAFTLLVLNQYQNSKITFSAAADILNLRSRHIAKLEANL